MGHKTRIQDIVFESGEYWVRKAPTGFEVFKIGATCSTRVARIGWRGELGLEKAKQFIERRAGQ